MNQKYRRLIASWWLLAIFVPMLVFSTLHVHEKTGVEVTAEECADCVHHSCHGHMSSLVQWSHECVLCQFLTLTFVATAVAGLTIINKVFVSGIDARQCHVCMAHSGIVGLRAPPAFSI
ncbi:MAG: hypothetical protein J6Y33_03595 [Prevotella sp.]|nr:hypothetical protein [Prevotella sp.]